MNLIEQNNILIAGFLGWQEQKDPTERFFGSWKNAEGRRIDKILHFDNDWNWLMVAVEKIESLGYWLNRINGDVWIFDDNNKIIINNPSHSGGIESIHKIVIEFIKWHSSQQK